MRTLEDLMKVMRESTPDESMADVVEVVVELTCEQMAKEIMVAKGIIGKDNKMYLSYRQLQENINKFLNQ